MLDIGNVNASGKIQQRMIILKQNKYLGMKPRALGKPVCEHSVKSGDSVWKTVACLDGAPKVQLRKSKGRSARPGRVQLRENVFCILIVCIQFHYLCTPIKTYRMPKWMSEKLLSLLITVLFISIECLFLRQGNIFTLGMMLLGELMLKISL